jgi:hypothetical protein
MEHFVNSHPEVKAEGKKLGRIFHKKMVKLEGRLRKTGNMLDSPKYKAELEAIGAKMQALDLKVKKALKWDSQGLKMWKLHMNNKKFKEIAADDEAIKQDMEKFIGSHPKINAELKDLCKDIQAEFAEVGHRLEATGKMLDSPKYKHELEAIGQKWKNLDAKFKKNLHWDDEGLKMWKLSLDPKVDQEIQQGKADVWRDIQNLDKPAHKLGMEFQKYQHDQEINKMQIGRRFEMAIHKLDTPKHRMQLQKIEARWNRLQAYTEREENAILGDLETFVRQPEINNELRDLEGDVAKEMHEMDMRYKQFQMDVDRKHAPEIERRLNEIGRKLEALDYKFEKNLKFDPETKMWMISMDNKVHQEIKKDEAELKQDIEKFVDSHKEVEAELNELGHELEGEMQDVQKELMESAKLLEDPKYKAELEAIAAKMKALDAKFKANIKFEQ